MRISQPPRNVEQFVNGSATMLCSASAPASVDLAVVWRFNGHAIDMKRFVEFLLVGLSSRTRRSIYNNCTTACVVVVELPQTPEDDLRSARAMHERLTS